MTPTAATGRMPRSAEHGFSSQSRSVEHGFTLVELMVALAIFAMVSAAGVMLLRASIDTQSAVAKRLGEGSGVARLRAIMASELASAQPRPARDSNGERRPALIGTSGSIAFVHAAGDDPLAGRLARSAYALDGGAIVRTGYARVDGVAEGERAALLRDVTALAFRYRGLDGGWSDAWTPDDPARLPRAVEMVVTRRAAAPLTLRFLVGPDGLPPPGQVTEGATP